MITRRKLLKGIAQATSLAVCPRLYSQVQTVEVLLSFDGGESLSKWKKSMDLARRITLRSGNPVHFTYFLNSAYLFERLPEKIPISYGGTVEDIEERKTLIQQAIADGHEVACHTVHHRHGRHFNKDDWIYELNLFDRHVSEFFKDRSGEAYNAVGFRAPFLECSPGLYPALKDSGYLYDSSNAGEGIEVIDSIPSLKIPFYRRDDNSKILGMDYNWEEAKVQDSELERMLTRRFELCRKSRKPLIVSMHFEDWGFGNRTYWQTVISFFGERLPELRFCSFRKYLEGP